MSYPFMVFFHGFFLDSSSMGCTLEKKSAVIILNINRELAVRNETHLPTTSKKVKSQPAGEYFKSSEHCMELLLYTSRECIQSWQSCNQKICTSSMPQLSPSSMLMLSYAGTNSCHLPGCTIKEKIIFRSLGYLNTILLNPTHHKVSSLPPLSGCACNALRR